MTAGLVVFTAANSSLAIPAVTHLLQTYPDHTYLLTVRDASDSYPTTKLLRQAMAKFPAAKATITQLDLASLSATHEFADGVSRDTQSGKYPPLAAVVCNAYYWNLVGDPEPSEDGFDKTIQVTFLSQAALVLRLLGSFRDQGGRIVLLSSDCHWPGKNGMETYPPAIPEDLELLVKPTVDEDKQGRGYQRYANAKLAVTAWMHALNRHLDKDANLSKITAVAINPGGLVDSRSFLFNTPTSLHYQQTFLYKPLLPVFRLLMGPTIRKSTAAGVDVAEITLSPKFAGERGFFTMLEKDESSPDSQKQEIQDKLWKQTLIWSRVDAHDVALGSTS